MQLIHQQPQLIHPLRVRIIPHAPHQHQLRPLRRLLPPRLQKLRKRPQNQLMILLRPKLRNIQQDLPPPLLTLPTNLHLPLQLPHRNRRIHHRDLPRPPWPMRPPQSEDMPLRPRRIRHDHVRGRPHARVDGGKRLPVEFLRRAAGAGALAGVDAAGWARAGGEGIQHVG